MRWAVLMLMLGGCSLVATSARPDHTLACASPAWPVLDLIGIPLATGMAAMAMYVAGSEEQTTRENIALGSTLILPPLYIASTIVGFSRNSRCRDALARVPGSP